MKTNKQKFLETYLPLLQESIKANPEKYAYRIDNAPIVAQKVCEALMSSGIASITPAIKQAAKLLGVNPTEKAIREFLIIP